LKLTFFWGATMLAVQAASWNSQKGEQVAVIGMVVKTKTRRKRLAWRRAVTRTSLCQPSDAWSIQTPVRYGRNAEEVG
jgi:hypothetical protein